MERLRRVKNYGIGLIILIGIVVVPMLYLYGVVWFSAKILPLLFVVCIVAFAVCLLVLLPLSIFRRIRPWTGLGLYFASYLFGTMLFAFSCLVTVELWGVIGLIVGLFIMGVGVVPVAFLAALFHGEWSLLGYIVCGTVLTFGLRFLGMWFAESNPDRDELLVSHA
jgi:hypothetical protein